MLKEKNKMKRIRKKKKTRLDLIMIKYSLIIQCREQIKGSQIANLNLIIHNPKSTGNKCFAI